MANKHQGYWADENYADNCAGCSKPFSYSVWKHHCYRCGEIFCDTCSDKKRPVPEKGHGKSPVRVCQMCFIAKQKEEEKRRAFEQMGDTVTQNQINAFLSEADLEIKQANQEVMDSLLRIYKAKVKPLEQRYRFDYYYSSLNDGDFEPRPIVLLLGQYSVGKTTFIRSLLERDFQGIRIGPEPTTDGFHAITYGPTDRAIPGNAAAVDVNRQFVGLAGFGANFLSRFQVAEVPSPLLDSLTIVDTPGVLSGEKQRLDRGYDFEAVVRWFVERADRILLLFDAHKLDISDEFKRVIMTLKGNDDKVRVVLNKADQVETQQLMRVYGALMWSLGKVFDTPEVCRVYMGSFWDKPIDPRGERFKDLFIKEKEDLIEDLKGLQRHCAIRKVNEMVKRTRLVRAHATMCDDFKQQLPVFGKGGAQKKIAQNISKHLDILVKKQCLSIGDFPQHKQIEGFLSTYKLEEFKDLNQRYIEIINIALSRDIPRMLDTIQKKQQEHDAQDIQDFGNNNPFDEFATPDSVTWVVDAASKQKYDNVFYSLSPQGNPPKVSGGAARPVLLQSGLPVEALRDIWGLVTSEGSVDQDEFALMMFLIQSARQNGVQSLPKELPLAYIPPSKRQQQLQPINDVLSGGSSSSGDMYQPGAQYQQPQGQAPSAPEGGSGNLYPNPHQ